MKYGRVVDLRQPSFSSPALSELRLRSAALLTQRPPLFLRQRFLLGELYTYYVCLQGRQAEQSIIDSLLGQLNFVRGEGVVCKTSKDNIFQNNSLFIFYLCVQNRRG